MANSFVLRYAVFAAIATLLNIATQYVSSVLYGGYYEFYVAMAAGTLAGLIVKYCLDKRWIFYDRSGSLRGHSVKFTLYTLTGIFTTFIFWGTELAFEVYGTAPYSRYIGAVIGLTMGYTTKYQLDRRFVFREQPR